VSRFDDLTGPEKAAILLLSLDEDRAASVMREMKEDEVTAVVTEIAALHVVEQATINKVIDVFAETRTQDSELTRGGVDRARSILAGAMDAEAASAIIGSLDQGVIERPFSWLMTLPPDEVSGLLAAEHPQTVAIALSFLSAEAASAVMAGLPVSMRKEVGIRISRLEEPTMELVTALESGLKERLGPNAFKRQYGIGGIDTLVALLNHSDRNTEREVIEALAAENEELAAEVKKRLFVFEDITQLDDRSIQQVLRNVDASILPMALKGVRPEVQLKITGNLSSRATQNLLEEIELLGPVRAADVDSAQASIVAVINQLEQSGDIMISRGGDALIS